ncbi:ABC transporter ATP-binding protein [Heliorestis acidaminivorans]|uniref:ABC transporter ATP-binding protein n=1 Tax=Heliorestis acidaminivorans TaxID=553427 RepID=A0A6I0ERE5_9FIRM|nr:ABC transporter ATP-binding protein [Heliorestis acidaminivorans]KAB2952116.1 ABC transporter ATP-binding protein [Heliorestis acidaminivorans]
MTSAVLEVKDLSFCYEEGRPILQDLHLTIREGERVGLIGPNGAGKTTLFLLAGGILKAVSGQIRLCNQPVVPGIFRPELGMVFQNVNDQLFCPSVREDLAFGPTNMGLSPQEVERRVRSASIETGVEKLLERPPHQLSGGEKRMVAMAGILAMGSRLLLLDEPSANLDMRYRRRLINLLQKRQDCSMLIASHDLEVLLELCDRVILLAEGTIQADGLPKKIMAHTDLMHQYGLEVPHSLRRSLRKFYIRRG